MNNFSVQEDSTRIFLHILKVLNSISLNCLMIIDKDSISFTVIDDLGRCLVTADVNKDLFQKWNVRKTHILQVNIDTLRKVIQSNGEIIGICDNNSSVRLDLENLNGVILIASNDKLSENQLKVKKITRKNSIVSLKIKINDFTTFLKTASQIADDIKFEINKDRLIMSAQYLNFLIFKNLSLKKYRHENKSDKTEFIIPTKYLKSLISLLNSADSLQINLTDTKITEFIVIKKGIFRLKMWISSNIIFKSNDKLSIKNLHGKTIETNS